MSADRAPGGFGCRDHAGDGARTIQASAVARGSRGRRRTRTCAPIASDPHIVQKSLKEVGNAAGLFSDLHYVHDIISA